MEPTSPVGPNAEPWPANETTAVGHAPESPRPAPGLEPGLLTEVDFASPLGMSFVEGLIGVAGTAVLCAVPIGAGVWLSHRGLGEGWVGVIVVFLALVLVGLVLLLAWRARWRAQLHAISVTRGSFGPTIAAICRIGHLWGVEGALLAALKTFVSLGHTGLTVRIGRAQDSQPVEPAPWPFEPQLLDEAYSALIVDQTKAANAARAGVPSGGLDESVPLRLVRRNLRLKGGWWVLVLPALVWGYYAIDAVRSWRIGPGLFFCTVVLLATLFMRPTRGAHQWLVVPGGLVRRTGGRFQKQWRLHLFERSSSVLCVVRWSGQRWRVLVADGTEIDRHLVTRNEMDFLLRAWLSPWPPPAAERLDDLR